MSQVADPILKLVTPEQWNRLETSGAFGGSADDLRDGFIHLSFGTQVEKTWRKHFGAHPDVLVLRVDAERLGAELKIEESGSKKLYPHLYRSLLLSDVLSRELASAYFSL